MKKIITYSTFFILIASIAKAIVSFDAMKPKKDTTFIFTGFSGFAPLGVSNSKESFQTAYQPIIDAASDFGAFEVEYLVNSDHQKNLQNLETNEADIFIGCTADTHDYRNLELLYPSVLTSPISLITLPTTQINKITQLKNLKAGVSKNEPFSDFIKSRINQYNTTTFNNYEEMFKALFNKEIDFIFTNYYHGVIKISEYGLNNEVSLSKKGIWQTPLFICINPQSLKYNRLLYSFQDLLKDPKTSQIIQEYLVKMINEIKIKNRNVSAPEFVTEKDQNNG